MLAPESSLKQIRLRLKDILGKVYSGREPDSLIQLIFDHFGLTYMDSFTNPETQLKPEIIAQINEITKDIAKKKPIQYILGYTMFHGLKINVNAHVLIPRPETEELVARIIKEKNTDNPIILDIGTGSGCIAIALKHAFPAATLYAVDKYPQALDTARENAHLHHLDINFLEADMLMPTTSLDMPNPDIIVSNPPYVTPEEKQWMDKNVLDYEPHSALFVRESDPLEHYRAIAHFAAVSLNAGGALWVEVNEQFGQDTCNLFERQGFVQCRLIKDMHGKDRFVNAMIPL